MSTRRFEGRVTQVEEVGRRLVAPRKTKEVDVLVEGDGFAVSVRLESADEAPRVGQPASVAVDWAGP